MELETGYPQNTVQRGTLTHAHGFVFCNETVRPAYAICQIFYRGLISREILTNLKDTPEHLKILWKGFPNFSSLGFSRL